ncbi:MAG: Mu-like prophage major head subunit gpT family protein [Tabrizicola sp.]|uniref:prohead protease/major capsid protein fusion protein n=1 Tax=Tabrizicola sp. TaxID=2005166 RepID=UPI00273373C7|nr:prohead protease/major capsid protein fusion protein [Tabrizicola sp.]MDP3263470.1 Mu-like prophage major head subunit gpT family protein [Tabrizicola sp.]MDP3646827.1 Mu-like prophage major head subunit gpT family protein [Paracoccaceae bacterium]
MAQLDINLTRAAVFQPSTWNAEAQTIEAVISTFADVVRRDSKGAYLERLDPAGLNLSGLEGAPLLDGHRTESARDVIGSITGHRFEGGKLLATIRLSGAADAAPIVARIAEGTVRGVSIGYRVSKWTEEIDPETKTRIRKAVAWMINEASAVPIGADRGARFRSGDIQMTTENEEKAQTRQEIRAIARSANLPADWADAHIDADATVTDVRAAAFEEIQKRGKALPVIKVGQANDDPAQVRTRAADALAFRMVGGDFPAASREFVGMSLRDIAADCLTRSGESVRGMSADDLFQRSLTTSDFPVLVSNAMGKVAAQAYQAAESPLKALARQRTLPNFKESTSIRIGEMGRLEEMTESGEFKHTNRAESGEVMRLKTFGRAINVSRKLLIDDDLNLLGDMTAAMGQAAAQTEAEEMVAMLTGNPDLSDGTPVFDASRGNSVSGAPSALSETALSAARKHMRTVKGLDGKTTIAATPKYLVVSPDLETSAEKLLASIYAATTDDVAAFAGKLTLVVEPRLTGNTWYVLADPAQVPSLQYGYLAAAQGVQIQRQEAWNTLGLQYRAFLDFGSGWLDWRGAYRAAGA